MKPTFFNQPRPMLTAMIQEATPDDAIHTILNAHYDGADGFGILLADLERQYHTPEHLHQIFEACMGKPIYITSYRNKNNSGMSDDQCMDLLLMGCEAGATLCDIMGDAFAAHPHELTDDPAAIEKQMALIDTIHAMGSQVLLSSHTHAFLDEDTVVRYALEHKRRGADVAKIVIESNTTEEQESCLKTVLRLNREMDGTPFLFLSGGKYSRLLRQLGPSLGVCMYLCVPHYSARYSREQPLLRAMKAVRDNLVY